MENWGKFEIFGKTDVRIDKVLSAYLHENQKFVLSHGESAIERGFSISKTFIDGGLAKESITISKNGVWSHEFTWCNDSSNK